MTKKVRGANCPISLLRHLLPIAAVLLLAVLLIAPVAAEEVTVMTVKDLQQNITDGKSIIRLGNNIGVSSESETITIGSGKTVTIIGDGHYINRTGSGDFFLISVKEGGKLTLEGGNGGLFIDGNKTAYQGGKYGLIIVTGDGSELVMKDGVTLQNSNVIASSSSDCKRPTDGTTGSYVGAAVQVLKGAKFLMEGGTISHNIAWIGGGVYVATGGNFTMTSGIISENSAGNDNGGDEPAKRGWGGAVQNEKGGTTIICGNSVISENSAPQTGGIQTTGKLLVYGNANISHNTARVTNAGGILIGSTGTCDIFGNVEISYNTAVDCSGGIQIGGNDKSGGILNLSGNVEIFENTAGNGGGICSYKNPAPVNISGNVKIYNNHASSGGGIYLHKSYLNLNGGEIYNNVVTGTGGGVRVYGETGPEKAKMEMTAGKIYGNIAGGNGGGVDCDGTLNLTGGEITGNTAGSNAIGGGIYYSHGVLNIGGNPTVKDNIASGKANDIALRKANANDGLTLSEELAPGTLLYITIQESGVPTDPEHATRITRPYAGNDYSAYFVLSNDPAKYTMVGLPDEDEPEKIAIWAIMRTYGIEKGTSQNGTVMVKSDAQVNETVTLTAVPEDGYQLDKFSVKLASDGSEVPLTGEGNTFKMPVGNVIVTATFTEKTYDVKAGSIEHGTFTQITAEYKDTVTVDINNIDAGYAVGTISAMTDGGKPVDVTGNTFVMPADNVSVSVEFTKTPFKITYASTAEGTISGVTEACVGDIVTVTPNPTTNYALKCITISGGDIVSGTSFRMPAAEVTVTPVFSQSVFAIDTVATDETGNPLTGAVITTTVDGTGSASAEKGKYVFITATPATGYELVATNPYTVKKADNTEVTVTVTGSDYNFTMPEEAVTVYAKFAKINYNIAKGTGITKVEKEGASGDITTAQLGDKVTVTIEEQTGKEFSHLIITNTDDATKFTMVTGKTFDMPAYDVTVSAVFVDKVYTISTTTENGTIEATHTSAKMGTAVTFLAKPKAGYEFVKFNITPEGGTSEFPTDNSYTYTMTAANITVTFEVKPIAYAVGIYEDKATLTLNPNVNSATIGESITVTATADAGYVLNQIQIVKTDDGTVYDTIQSGESFTMPAFGVTVKAVGQSPAAPPAPSSSGSSGSSTWLPSEPTETPTPTPTPTETDVAPTDIPSTQPTEPKSPGFGVLAVLAGLGAVAVLRRK